jgi:tetratricopeptide (TPR) repeat protein
MAERGPSVGARHNQSGDHRRHIPPALIEALQRQPLAWFEAERRSLVVAVERAGELGLHRLASELSVSLMSSFRLFNSFDEWGRTHAAALAAARLAGDRRAEATILLGLGHLRYEQDRFSDADEYYRDALSASREVGERHNEASALIGLAAIRRDHGHFAEALHFLSQATVICRALDDLVGTADAAYGIGYVHCETGDLAQAQASLEIALDAYRASGDRRGEGLTLRSIGLVHRARGDLAYASEFSAQAIDAFLEVGDALLEAYGVQALAKVHIRQGRVAGVQMRLSRCLDVCRQLGDRFGAALMLRTLGELHLALNELDTAVEYLDEAIAAWERLDLGLFRARTQRDLAVAYERRGDTAAAHAVRSAAVATFREFGSRECNELTFGVHREHSGPVPTKPRDRWLVADGARLQQPD